MPSLQALSQRLKSVTSTARLTKTMKVVASVKLKVSKYFKDRERKKQEEKERCDYE